MPIEIFYPHLADGQWVLYKNQIYRIRRGPKFINSIYIEDLNGQLSGLPYSQDIDQCIPIKYSEVSLPLRVQKIEWESKGYKHKTFRLGALEMLGEVDKTFLAKANFDYEREVEYQMFMSLMKKYFEENFLKPV